MEALGPKMETHAVTTDVPALARLQQRAPDRGRRRACSPAQRAPFMNPDQFFRSWLIGFLFCLGLTLGSLALLMLQHLSGGQWGLVGRRVFEAASRNLPFVALLFVPLLFGLPRLYHWAAPGARRGDDILQKKARLPERAVLHRPRGALLRRLDALHVAAERVVRRRRTAAKSRVDPGRHAPLPRRQRARTAGLRR